MCSLIEVKNLEFTYPDAKESAVKGVTFSVNEGEIFGFLGPNGAGKTTTQNILNGMLKQYRGSVFVMGKSLKDWDSLYYERIGVSFELPALYSKLTGLENLAFFGSFYSKKTEDPERLLEMVDLEKDGDLRVSNYSKGMKVRLNFVRALLNDPELIFLDEPTAGLDPLNARKIKAIIKKKKSEKKTIFLTTHDMSVADELCDRVAFIVDGRINLVENPKNLKIMRGKNRVKVEYLKNGRAEEKEFSLEGVGDNDDFINLLRTEDIQTIHTLEPTLEDIFIEETGRGLQ
ncbi:MAG: ABC transporter ATP-binding protein [Halobacteriota archaeon]|nr:ABC transporter ATP-binding protein [Halobacteriota archaeon]